MSERVYWAEVIGPMGRSYFAGLEKCLECEPEEIRRVGRRWLGILARAFPNETPLDVSPSDLERSPDLLVGIEASADRLTSECWITYRRVDGEARYALASKMLADWWLRIHPRG